MVTALLAGNLLQILLTLLQLLLVMYLEKLPLMCLNFVIQLLHLMEQTMYNLLHLQLLMLYKYR